MHIRTCYLCSIAFSFRSAVSRIELEVVASEDVQDSKNQARNINTSFIFLIEADLVMLRFSLVAIDGTNVK